MPTDAICASMENFRLKVFRVVASHLNFSRAAEELLLTQPAVTQQIKALEDEYGVSLFDRSGGGLTLTPRGRGLLPYAGKRRAHHIDASWPGAAALCREAACDFRGCLCGCGQCFRQTRRTAGTGSIAD